MDVVLLRRLIKDTVGRSLRRGTVTAVHANCIDVQVGGSPKILRGLSTIGGVDDLSIGDTVLLQEAGGRIYAQSAETRIGGRHAVIIPGAAPHAMTTHLDEDEWHASRVGSALHIPKAHTLASHLEAEHAPTHGHAATDPTIHIGSTAPATPYPGMLWLDTS